MEVSYYRIKFSNYYSVNEFECPVEYFLKKYSMQHYLPLPRSKRYLNEQYVVAIPTKIADDFVSTLVTEEDGKAVLIKKEQYNYDGFENTYVYEVNERVNGVNVSNLSIFKRLQ